MRDEVRIRPYQPGDRQDVRRISADTAFLGEALDPIFQDRELWCDLMVTPYLTLQPQYCWVAEAGGSVVGYLTGAALRWFGQVSMPWQIYTTLRMLARRLGGAYDARSRRFVDWLVLRGLREKADPPGRYFAHFHFNLDPGYRGLGCGPAMLARFEEQLRREGIHDLYAESLFRQGDPDPRLWARLGFREHRRRRTRMFVPPVDVPLYWVCYLKDLRRAGNGTPGGSRGELQDARRNGGAIPRAPQGERTRPGTPAPAPSGGMYDARTGEFGGPVPDVHVGLPAGPDDPDPDRR